MTISSRARVIGLAVLAVFVFYVLVGFFAVPPLVKWQLSAHVEEKLEHKLNLGEVKFNPLTLTAELVDFDLRESTGAALISFKRLLVDFETTSLFRRAWTFAEVSVDGLALNGELRENGSHNFSALLAALRDPESKPDSALPRLVIDKITIIDGRVDLADRQGGETARLRLAPIAFELTELSTLPSEKSPYKLNARSVDGELLQWGGEISLNPIASSGKLALSKWRVATLARLLGNRVSIAAAAGEIDATLSYQASYANGKADVALNDMAFKLSGLSVTPQGASEPLATIETFDVAGVKFDLGARSVSANRVGLNKARIALEMNADGRGNWGVLLPGAQDRSPAVESAAATSPHATGNVRAASVPPWRIKLTQVQVSDLDMKYSDRRPAARSELVLQGVGLDLVADLERRDDTSSVALEGFKLKIAQGSIVRGTQSISTKDIAVAAGSAKAERSATGIDLGVATIEALIANLGLRQGSDDIRMEKVALANQSIKVTLPADPSSAIELALDELTFDAAGIGGKLGTAKADVLELRSLVVAAKSVSVALAGEIPDIKANGMSASLAGLALRDPGNGGEMARLGRAEAIGGTLNLRERRTSIDRITAADGHAAAVMRSDGKLNWDALLAVFANPADKPGAVAAKGATQGVWKAMAKAIDLRKFGGTYTDERQRPALSVALDDVNARARNAGTDRATPAQIDLSGRIKDGGQFNAVGRINLQSLESDLKVKLSGLSLGPAQALLARYARVELLSALASADGRLRYNQPKTAGANLVFEGEFGLTKVVIDETEPKQPFLSLDALKASDVRLALDPDRLEIPEVRVTGLATRLLIADDQSVNIVKLLRPRTEGRTVPPLPAAQSPPVAPSDTRFPIAISRIRIDQTRLDFADLSLRPQFATRMHELQGVINGVSTARDSRAQMELEARVDEFGSARIRGEINPFQPRVYTDIDMAFRNIEMTALTPYSAKFAGYRIASGRLSMDLQYKIKNGALVGENKLVLDKLELGERVESPTAFNLPLELAIAILKDADGRIDIGLPVSGSLDDPQFSYGQLIWKAIGNLLTRIVTAPFRALAGLFGGGAETLGSIEFDAGADRLLPPERQKLRTVAEALHKRPQLKLTVKPAYAPVADRAALQSLAARRAVSERAGIKLQPGEAPGPIDFTNSRVQRAIDSLFRDQFTAAAARELRAGVEKAAVVAPEPGDAGKPASKPVAVAAADIARAMADKLTAAFTIDDAALSALARQRGDAIAQELRETGKVDPARLAIGTPQSSSAATGKVVVTELDLGVAK